jgi:hypothetical protein
VQWPLNWDSPEQTELTRTTAILPAARKFGPEVKATPGMPDPQMAVGGPIWPMFPGRLGTLLPQDSLPFSTKLESDVLSIDKTELDQSAAHGSQITRGRFIQVTGVEQSHRRWPAAVRALRTAMQPLRCQEGR